MAIFPPIESALPSFLSSLSNGDLINWGTGKILNEKDPLTTSMIMAEARYRGGECQAHLQSCSKLARKKVKWPKPARRVA